jgi:hypothetical protein
MNLFDGSEEPECKRLRPHKLILEPPVSFDVCGVSRDVWWFKIILSNAFLLVDLIRLKRTCKALALFKPLRWLIKAKEEAAFGKTPKPYWNVVRQCPYTDPLEFVGQQSSNKFVLFIRGTQDHFPYDYMFRLGVFSHKTEICKALSKLNQEFRRSETIIENKEGYVEMLFIHAVIFVQGLSREQIKKLL